MQHDAPQTAPQTHVEPQRDRAPRRNGRQRSSTTTTVTCDQFGVGSASSAPDNQAPRAYPTLATAARPHPCQTHLQSLAQPFAGLDLDTTCSIPYIISRNYRSGCGKPIPLPCPFIKKDHHRTDDTTARVLRSTTTATCNNMLLTNLPGPVSKVGILIIKESIFGSLYRIRKQYHPSDTIGSAYTSPNLKLIHQCRSLCRGGYSLEGDQLLAFTWQDKDRTVETCSREHVGWEVLRLSTEQSVRASARRREGRSSRRWKRKYSTILCEGPGYHGRWYGRKCVADE